MEIEQSQMPIQIISDDGDDANENNESPQLHNESNQKDYNSDDDPQHHQNNVHVKNELLSTEDLIKNASMQHNGDLLVASGGTSEPKSLLLYKVIVSDNYETRGEKNKVTFKKLNTNQPRKTLVQLLQWSPNDCLLATACDTLTVFSFSKQEEFLLEGVLQSEEYHLQVVCEFRDHPLELTALSWSPSSSQIASSSLASQIIIRSLVQVQSNAATTTTTDKIVLDAGCKVLAIRWDSLDKYLVALAGDNQVLIWKTHQWEQIKKLSLDFSANPAVNNQSLCKREDRKIDWSPDHKFVLMPSLDDKNIPIVVAVDRQNFNVCYTFMGPFSSINCIKFNPNLYRMQNGAAASVFAMGDNDGNISIWAISDGDTLIMDHPFFLFKSHQNGTELIEDLCWNTEGNLLIATTMKRYITLMLFDDGIFGNKLNVKQKQEFLQDIYGEYRSHFSAQINPGGVGGQKQTFQVFSNDDAAFNSIETEINNKKQQQPLNNRTNIVADSIKPQVSVYGQQSTVIENGKKKIVFNMLNKKPIINNPSILQNDQQCNIQSMANMTIQEQQQVNPQQPQQQTIQQNNQQQVSKTIEAPLCYIATVPALAPQFIYPLNNRQFLEVFSAQPLPSNGSHCYTRICCVQMQMNVAQPQQKGPKQILWTEILPGKLLIIEKTQKWLLFYTDQSMLYLVSQSSGKRTQAPFCVPNLAFAKISEDDILFLLKYNGDLQINRVFMNRSNQNNNQPMILKENINSQLKSILDNCSNSNNMTQANENPQPELKHTVNIKQIFTDKQGMPYILLNDYTLMLYNSSSQLWQVMNILNCNHEVGVFKVLQEEVQSRNSFVKDNAQNINIQISKNINAIQQQFDDFFTSLAPQIQSQNQTQQVKNFFASDPQIQKFSQIACLEQQIAFFIQSINSLQNNLPQQQQQQQFIATAQQYLQCLCDAKEINKIRMFFLDFYVNSNANEKQYAISLRIDLSEFFKKCVSIVRSYYDLAWLAKELYESHSNDVIVGGGQQQPLTLSQN